MFGKYSTTVTSVPIELYTYANSIPIAPEPTISNFFGCDFNVIASRYPMIFVPSCGKLGNCLEREPVAIITAFSALYSVIVPSSAVTATFFPAFTVPKPLMMSILFFFIKN